jgi:hypothetical protein
MTNMFQEILVIVYLIGKCQLYIYTYYFYLLLIAMFVLYLLVRINLDCLYM